MRWLTARSDDTAAPGRPRRGQKRPRVVPWWRTWTVRATLAATVLAGIAGGVFWVWQQRLPHRLMDEASIALIQSTADLGFRVDEVFVIGRKETARNSLGEAIGVDRGEPILFVDLHQVRSRVLSLPWVAEADVERMLPDTLIVRVVERQPLAIWQYEGTYALIDASGAVIQRHELERFADLLVVVGSGAQDHADTLLALLETESPLYARVESAVRVGDRRWNVHLNGGIEIRLPEEDAAEAWARLAKYQKRHGVLDRGVGLLDLRFPDQVIVRQAAPPAIEDAIPTDQGQDT